MASAIPSEFLQDIRSDLVNEQDTKTMYRCLRIAVPVNGHDVPKNVGLLFFSQDPEQWFSGARIEVVQFAADASGNVMEEKIFNKRPIHEQLRECLSYLENLSVRQLEKVPHRPEVIGWVSYPSQALREALVNAVYHRSYEAMPEPVKVYLYPDRMEIISYPGPVPGIEKRHLDGSDPLPPVPARNRRIGEFLKELRLAEGRGTGLPKVRRSMQENGSPLPRFDFGDARSYFRVTLPAHPEYIAILALQDAARLRAIGDSKGALERLHRTLQDYPSSVIVAAELIEALMKGGDLAAAHSVLEEFVENNPGAIDRSANHNAYKRLLREAREMLERVVQMEAPAMRRAWAWYDLGRVLKWSKAPLSEIRRAFGEACRLQPEERRFLEALERLDHER